MYYHFPIRGDKMKATPLPSKEQSEIPEPVFAITKLSEVAGCLPAKAHYPSEDEIAIAMKRAAIRIWHNQD